jgi:hypothetical protein
MALGGDDPAAMNALDGGVALCGVPGALDAQDSATEGRSLVNRNAVSNCA